MAHVGLSKNFLGMVKETSTAYLFDMGGVLAGFLIAYGIGIFDKAPWAIAIYPAILSSKGIINGLFSSRLSAALHLGTVKPQFLKNQKGLYKILEAIIVLTLILSAAVSLFALIFGTMFWGITLADFFSILLVIIATMTLGLLITLVTMQVTFVSFKRGLDPDTTTYPLMSTISNILITLCFIGVLNLFFFGTMGQWIIAAICLIHVFLAVVFIPHNLRVSEFTRTIKESILPLVLVAFLVNITGTVLKTVNSIAANPKPLLTLYPPMIDIVGDVGLIVGSTATTKLALGLLRPSFSSIKNHLRNISSAWLASIVMFVILAALALVFNGLFSVASFSNLALVLIVTNAVSVLAIVMVTFFVSLITFRKGLDPDSFVLPLLTALADSIATAALLLALFILV
ncbi:MAG: magnesium transporter [Candidatus Bathyarchaeota archaeon]|nr:magnesium transporter [Candidatus Bathyarchaeota archaeon]